MICFRRAFSLALALHLPAALLAQPHGLFIDPTHGPGGTVATLRGCLSTTTEVKSVELDVNLQFYRWLNGYCWTPGNSPKLTIGGKAGLHFVTVVLIDPDGKRTVGGTVLFTVDPPDLSNMKASRPNNPDLGTAQASAANPPFGTRTEPRIMKLSPDRGVSGTITNVSACNFVSDIVRKATEDARLAHQTIELDPMRVAVDGQFMAFAQPRINLCAAWAGFGFGTGETYLGVTADGHSITYTDSPIPVKVTGDPGEHRVSVLWRHALSPEERRQGKIEAVDSAWATFTIVAEFPADAKAQVAPPKRPDVPRREGVRVLPPGPAAKRDSIVKH